MGQRLYLLTADRHNDGGGGATFAVLGTTGNVYKVDFSLMPCCDCPDFQKGRGLCKHVLFIWLRVLRVPGMDPRIWQQALLTGELRAAIEPLFAQKSRRLPCTADRGVRLAYAKVTGSVAETTIEADQGKDRRKRQTLDSEECTVCFEAVRHHLWKVILRATLPPAPSAPRVAI